MLKISKIFVVIIFIYSCSGSILSKNDKKEIAIITCNILAETKEFNSAQTIKEVNLAREKIGQERFLGTSQDIKDAFKFNICIELILNTDDEYLNKLEIRKDIVRISDENDIFSSSRKKEIKSNNLEIESLIFLLEKFIKITKVIDIKKSEKDSLEELLNRMNKFTLEPLPNVIFSYEFYNSDKSKYLNYKKKQETLIGDYMSLEKIISSIELQGRVLEYHKDIIQKTIEKYESNILTAEEYDEFCYIFSKDNPKNFSSTTTLTYDHIPPFQWDYVIDNKEQTIIENMCLFDFFDQKNLFHQNN